MFEWLKDKELTGAGKVAWGSLLLMVFLVPITFIGATKGSIPFIADVFDTPKITLLRILIMVALGGWIADIVLYGGKIRYSKWIFATLGAYLAWVSISTVIALEPMISFLGKYRRYDGLWSFFIYATLFFLTVQYATSAKRVRQLGIVLSLSSFIVAGYGFFQALGIDFFAWGALPFEPNRSFSTYGNPDLLAGFLAFGVFINAGLALSESNVRVRAIYWIGFLINSAVVITAFARSIWVGAFVGAVLFITLVVRQKVRFSNLDLGFLGASGAAVAAFVGFSLTRTNAVMNFASRFASIFKFNEGSAVTRFEIWDAASHAIAARPVFGWGPDSFRMVFRLFQPEAYARDAGYRSVADNVHNYPLQLAAGVGVIGMLLLYGIQIAVIAIGVKFCWIRDEKNRDVRIMYSGVLAACVAYIVHLLFGLSLPGCTFLLWIFLGVLLSPLCKSIEVQPVSMGAVLVGTYILVACAPVIFSGRLFFADHNFSLANVYMSDNQYGIGIDYYKKAASLNPYNDQYAIDYTSAAIRAAQQPTLEVNPEVAFELAKGLINTFPNEYDAYLVGLSGYAMAGTLISPTHYEEGAIIAQRQIMLMPNGLALRMLGAQLLATVGQTQAALSHLQYCVNHDPSFTEAAELMAQIKEQLANQK